MMYAALAVRESILIVLSTRSFDMAGRIMENTFNVEITTDFFAELRLSVDLKLLPEMPYFSGKPYPLGRCGEIRDTLFELLKSELKDTVNPNADSLKNYMLAGNKIIKIWGSLRDEYFQNALQIGDYYVDCANDTVNPNKPRIEILPMAESGFKPIEDFEEFARIAKKYWQVNVYKNTVCTSLAPFFPILFLDKHNRTWLTSNNNLFTIAQQSAFSKSERIIDALPEIDKHHETRWSALLDEVKDVEVLNNRYSAKDYCQIYRDLNLHTDQNFRDRVVVAFGKINRPV